MNIPTKAVLALAIAGFGIFESAPVLADGRHAVARNGVHGRGHAVAGGHRSHRGYRDAVRFGLFLGVPLALSSGYWGPRYYTGAPFYPAYTQPYIRPYISPYTRPYYPPVITVPVSPPTYIEQSPAASANSTAAATAMQPGYWYYCGSSQAYYPYVRECPESWQRVSPQPPG